MKSGIGRFASFAVLSLAVAVQALAADGPDAPGQGHPSAQAGGGQSPMTRQGPARPLGNWQPNPPQNQGGQWQGRPPGQGNTGGQWQGRPQGNNGGQWQGHPPGHDGGQWQGRPQGSNSQGQWQGHPPGNSGGGQWPVRPPGQNGWQGNPPGNGGGQWPVRPPGQNGWQGNASNPGAGQWPGGNGHSGSGRPPGNGDGHWQGQGRPPPSHGNWGPHPSYWRPGYVVNTMPPGHYRVPYRGSSFYFNDGYWYRPYGSRYVVVTPPYGVRVRYLPSYAEQVWIGSIGYFLAAGTYYLWQANTQDYEVVAPPQPQAVAAAPTGYEVIAYPMYGQSQEQQDRDRYECHRWAAAQSGFDPASAAYAPPPQVADVYRRAFAACLSGMGYSVN